MIYTLSLHDALPIWRPSMFDLANFSCYACERRPISLSYLGLWSEQGNLISTRVRRAQSTEGRLARIGRTVDPDGSFLTSARERVTRTRRWCCGDGCRTSFRSR